jgi:hypothetical protein
MLSKGSVALLLLAVIGLGACQAITELTEPTYAEIRFVHSQAKIELVTFIKTYGEESCREVSEQFIKDFMGGSGEGWSQTEKTCKKTLNELYQRVFNNEQIHATYIRIKEWGYDSRIVLYGVASSQALQVCEQIAADVEKTFNAEVDCVEGTVG